MELHVNEGDESDYLTLFPDESETTDEPIPSLMLEEEDFEVNFYFKVLWTCQL